MEYIICFRCWETVEYNGVGRRPKFCSECGKIVDDIKHKHKMQRKRGLGTSMLWEHPYPHDKYNCFSREWDAIQREKRRLGLFF